MVASLRRARQGMMSLFWQAMAVAGASWAFAYAIVTVHQIVQTRLPPIPSMAEAGYLVFLLAMAVALVRLLPGIYGWRDLLDGGIVALALGLILSLTPLGALFESGEPAAVARWFLLAYAWTEILLVTLAVLVLLRTPPEARAPVLLILGGLLGVWFSDGQLIVLRLQGAEARGAAINAARLVSFTLLLLVPVATPDLRRVRPRESGLPTVLLPTVLAVGGAAVVAYTSVAGWSPVQTVIGAALLGLMLVRMTATGLEDLRLRRERAEALARLRTADAQRAMILRAISHEIRNPLTPVRLHAQMAAKKAPEVKDSTDIIQRHLSQVSRLANDLNLVAKSETSDFALELADADVGPLAARVVEAEAPNAAQRDVTLEATSDADTHAEVDEERIMQVLGNLVRNALKFSPPGGHVRIHVAGHPRAVCVEVRDSGRGLTRAEARRLFRPFAQVHDRDGQSVEDRGSGLGLFISRRLVEAHGGRIGVRSEGLGRGSTFWFEVRR